ncbi:S41 family peptidase [Rhizobium leguminosarum]|uniref:S41 family peptidase n=1 Tax=Rhizobium leguminosarum TaxID=384 RepID=UPI000481A688|nr:S41 family peptidase [Rhizobium leguminosarum]
MTETTDISAIDTVEKFYIAARVFSALDGAFAHWDDVSELNADSLFRQLLHEISAASSRFEFSLLMMKYLASFRNGHTEFVDFALMPQSLGVFPARLRDIGGNWFVTSSAVSGLRKGEEITRINDQNASDFLAKRLSYVSASREEYRGYGLFMKMHGLPESLELTTSGGDSFEVHRQPLLHGMQINVTAAEFEDHALIRIPSFDDPSFEEDAVSLVRRFEKKRYLILDVRGNGGGDTPKALIEALMERPYPGWIESSASRTGLELAETFARHEGQLPVGQTPRTTVTWSTGWKQPCEQPYPGRLAILVDVGCKSATEDFIMPFAVTKRATIIGETTAGSSGQPYVERPRPDILFTVGAKRQFFPDMRPFEGHGIKPDVEVDALAALRADTDLHLNIARETMQGGFNGYATGSSRVRA